MVLKTYLRQTMLRRLLTCLAIVTGLVSVSAPAQASVMGALESQIEQSQRACEKDRSEECACIERQRQQRARGEKPVPCRTANPVRIYIPTVHLGADRAHE
jgi:hypothetical protein